MELLAAERDAKRRRAAHRGKRVHSNKKSYNEVSDFHLFLVCLQRKELISTIFMYRS